MQHSSTRSSVRHVVQLSRELDSAAILLSVMERGAYPARRAAALSGVPWSTVHEWSRRELVTPSISAERTKLWSYTDLLALRLVYWLRHPDRSDGRRKRGVSMDDVRDTLASLRGMEKEMWASGADPVVGVTPGGSVVLDPSGVPQELSGQGVFGDTDVLRLVLPFEGEDGAKGPDLVQPRPSLRIVPGRLGGEPHVARSRVETRALAALARRGMGPDNIVRLFPALEPDAVVEAIDLENQLARNVGEHEVAIAA
jgi:uncharacterized protein (DUF433 family)/DNA-binding transcriptional MerR regulator